MRVEHQTRLLPAGELVDHVFGHQFALGRISVGLSCDEADGGDAKLVASRHFDANQAIALQTRAHLRRLTTLDRADQLAIRRPALHTEPLHVAGDDFYLLVEPWQIDRDRALGGEAQGLAVCADRLAQRGDGLGGRRPPFEDQTGLIRVRPRRG